MGRRLRAIVLLILRARGRSELPGRRRRVKLLVEEDGADEIFSDGVGVSACIWFFRDVTHMGGRGTAGGRTGSLVHASKPCMELQYHVN